jgi:L-lactate dehydrogenase complex protein LldG
MARAVDSEEIVVTDARTAILDRIDRALKTARIPVAFGGARALSSEGARALSSEGARAFQASGTLLEHFVAEARALGVETFVEDSPDAVRARLRSLVDGCRVLAWNPDRLPYGADAVVSGAARGSSPRDEQAAADVGVTGCHGAIAETGSLALLSLPGCPRAASLLPPLHVALVRPDDFFFGMGDFFEARKDQMAAASNCTFVTGPSRTADIELSLTIGVHGPARVVVIVGPDNS